MSSMQAAIGLAQLERIDELVDKKRRIFHWYRKELEDVDKLSLNVEPEGTVNTYWMVTAIIDRKAGLKKEDLMQLMKDKNIECRPFLHPLS